MIDRREALTLLALTTATLASVGATPRSFARTGALTGISAMTVAPDGRLLVADWRAGALVAIALPEAAAAPEGAFNVRALGPALVEAGALARATAMAFDPVGRRALVAVPTGAAPDAPMAIAAITSDGRVTLHDPAAHVVARVELADPPGDGMLWRTIPAASLTVTDLVVHGGEVLVAGLSNADFSATLRRVPYPLDPSATPDVARIEMYHTVHNQIETRAPVRAMAVVPIDGADHLLAAYTCTPLVTAPLATLTDGAQVRARTIAELGYGNTPIKVLPFTLTSYTGERSDWVLVANSSKAADLIPLADIVAASRRPGLSEPVAAPFTTTAGLSPLQVPLTGVVGVADQGPEHLIALRREAQSGELELVSLRKGAFFRLSDHVNEYDFPTYDYPADDPFQQTYIRPFHARLRAEEGFPELVR